jgi:hypothetical protein
LFKYEADLKNASDVGKKSVAWYAVIGALQ